MHGEKVAKGEKSEQTEGGCSFLGTCQKLARGRGVETEGGSQLFETQKREGS